MASMMRGRSSSARMTASTEPSSAALDVCARGRTLWPPRPASPHGPANGGHAEFGEYLVEVCPDSAPRSWEPPAGPRLAFRLRLIRQRTALHLRAARALADGGAAPDRVATQALYEGNAGTTVGPSWFQCLSPGTGAPGGGRPPPAAVVLVTGFDVSTHVTATMRLQPGPAVSWPLLWLGQGPHSWLGVPAQPEIWRGLAPAPPVALRHFPELVLASCPLVCACHCRAGLASQPASCGSAGGGEAQALAEGADGAVGVHGPGLGGAAVAGAELDRAVAGRGGAFAVRAGDWPGDRGRRWSRCVDAPDGRPPRGPGLSRTRPWPAAGHRLR
jgi:hypothetical protein